MKVERPKKEQDSHEPKRPEQIVQLLHDADEELGKATNDVCREKEISPATYHRWKQKYGATNVNA